MITKLPDGSAFFVAEIDSTIPPPADPVYWNPYNKAVQNHQTGEVDHVRTNAERAAHGLPVPWTPEIAKQELGIE